MGVDDNIHDWLWTGTNWTNTSLGTGEPAGLGRGLAAFWSPDGTQANVFYMGEDGQIYTWAWTTGTSWTNSALGDGVAAAQGTGMAAFWSPDGNRANVFYAGDHGAPYNAPISNWTFAKSAWTNADL